MPEVQISKKIFNNVYLPLLEDNTPLQILFGGSSSGKSVFAVGQRTVFDVMQGKRNYLVTRQIGRTLRNSVFNEINKVINDWGVNDLFNINKSDMVITCGNGSQIIFSGLDDADKLKSITPAQGVITDVIVEEATETEQASIKQLEKRLRGGSENTPKRLTLLFNPILQTNWIYKEYFTPAKWADDQREYRSEDIHILKTTYKDNLRFLTKQDVKRLENEKDQYYYDVYTLGKWGVLGEIIFKNVKYLNLSDPKCEYYLPEAQRTNRRHGLDFGFSSDPAAMPCMHFDKKRSRLYIYDELYERGLTNQDLARYVIDMIEKDRVICDSSEPKSIQELKNAGVNAIGAIKGKDSVNFGIQWLQGLDILVDVKCVNARREFSTYHWKKDKDGNNTKVPVDFDNHLIDGTRYGMEDDMEKKTTAINTNASVGNFARGQNEGRDVDLDKR